MNFWKEPFNSYLRGLDSTGKDARARGCSGYIGDCFAYAVLTANLFLETIGERLAECLSGADNVYMQPLTGAEPKQLTHFRTGEIESFDVTTDGKFVMTRGVRRQNQPPMKTKTRTIKPTRTSRLTQRRVARSIIRDAPGFRSTVRA